MERPNNIKEKNLIAHPSATLTDVLYLRTIPEPPYDGTWLTLPQAIRLREMLDYVIQEAEEKERKPQWPEGYENYGVFAIGRDLYVIATIASFFAARNLRFNHDAPDGYYNFPGSMPDIWEDIPSWIVRRNYNTHP